MQKPANRILSMLLALVMVLTMLPATVLADGETDVLEGWSVTLGESIGVNFYLNSADYTVNATVNGETVTPATSGEVVTVNVAAAQMTDTIGLTVKNGEEVVHTGEYSVRQYAETILTGDYADETKQIVKEMLNYGAAAQTYFAYNTGSLANAGYEIETPATVPTEVPEVTAEDNLDGIDLYGMSLVFRSKTAVRFYFTVSGSIEDYDFKVGTAEYEAVEKDGLYYVEIGDINPQDLSEEFTVYVNGGDLMATYSPLNYIVRKYNSSSSSAELIALVQALYGYHLEAIAYVRFLASEAVRPTEGNVAALNIYYIRDSAPMSFITKDAYPAGTTITFKAYQPYIADTSNNWWGVGTTTDAATGSIYTCAKAGNNMYSADNDNYWAEFSYTIPADAEDSYIYIAGAKNVAWINDLLLIDDVVITTPDGNSVSDGFEYGLTAGLFNFNAVSGNDFNAVTLQNLSPVTAQEALEVVKAQYGDTVSVGTELISNLWVKGNEFTVSWTASAGASVAGNKLSLIAQNEDTEYTLTVTVSKDSDTASYSWNGTVDARTGNVAALNIYYISESAPMSFITKAAYPAGTTITFKAYQPYISDTSNNWWGVAGTADAAAGSIYTCAKAGNKMYNANNNDCWAEYTYTLPEGSADSYFYIAGAKNIAWKDYPLLIDDVVITTPDGTVATDDFEAGLTAGLFNVNTASAVTLLAVNPATAEEALADLKASYGDNIAVGTELVSAWTLDSTNFDVSWTATGAASVTDGKLTAIAQNEAADYTLTATVTNDSDTASYSWNGTVDARTGNVAAITVNKLNEKTPMSFITKEAYAGGSTISFDAFVPTGATWWRVAYTTDPVNDVSIYRGTVMTSVKDAWAEYSVTLPDDGNSYYIYFVGEKGQWKDSEGNMLQLLIDNVTITSGSTVATDDFEGDSLFDFNAGAALLNVNPATAEEALADLKAAYGDNIAVGTELVSAWTLDSTNFDISWTATGAASVTDGKLAAIAQNEDADYTLTVTVTNDSDTASYSWNGTVDARTGNVAAITVNKLNEKTPMSFITKNAYAGGTTISFEAFVPTGATWWRVAYTTDPVNDVGIYKGTVMTSVKDVWSEYSLTLPDDGNSYYIYLTGAKGEWNDSEGNMLDLLVDNVVITAPDGTSVTDDFEGDSLFDFNAGAALLAVNAATAEEALAELKVSYGASIADGTELVTTWKVGGKNFTVQWTVDEGASAASIENNKLVLTPQGTTVNYLLTATVSDGEDTASYSWIDNVKPQANNVAAITIGKLSNDNTIRFITNDAYVGGSTISFDAYVPTGASWWRVAYTTDPVNDVSIYKGTVMTSVKDVWSEYSLTLPDDGNSYYIYLTGPGGEWKDTEGEYLDLLVDNVTITAPDGTIATDDFEGDSLFTLSNIAALQTIEPEEVTPRAGNYAAIYMDYLTEDTASFITKEAYAGGSTISFEAYLPEGASWWSVSWTTDPADVGLYTWQNGLGQNMSSYSVKGAWAEYSVTLPDDGNSYYVYIVGPKGEWEDEAVLIDNVVITEPGGTETVEDFENGLESSIFSYISRNSGGEDLVVLLTYNYALEVTVANLSTGIELITKTAFPAGTTVTFDAKVPEDHDWWALDWTTDPGSVNNESARYAHSSSGTTLKSFTGKWSNYTVTLPESGGPYHLYFAGPNEWGTNTLLIDNFKAVDADGNVLADENFNHAIADSVFVASSNAAAMYEVTSYNENDDAEVEFTAYAAPTVNRNVTAENKGAIGAAYRNMADAGFNKAIALHEGSSGTFTATDVDGIKAQIAERSAAVEAVAQIVMEKAGRYGISYYVKDWGLYNLGGTYTDDYGVDSSFDLTQDDFNEIISAMFDSDNPYSENTGYAGHFGYDEPFYADLEKVGWAAQAYKATGVGGELFVNLLPTYVNSNSPQLGAETNWDKLFGDYTYENYLNEYLTQTDGCLDYICWDYYPFMNATNAAGTDISSQQATRIQKYLAGYELMANAAKESDRELRIIIQSSGDSLGNKDLEGKSELSFQIYSGLAFGVKEFIYYMYSGSGTSGYDYIFRYDDQKYNDTVYGWAQAVNTAVHSFEEVYNEYTWSNVMKVDADSSSVMMNNLTGAVTSSDVLKVEGTGDYLVGMFTAKDSASDRQNAFMIVNAEYDPSAAAHDIVLTMAGASAMYICRDGEQTVMKLNDTQCILEDVQPGEGIFVVPLY